MLYDKYCFRVLFNRHYEYINHHIFLKNTPKFFSWSCKAEKGMIKYVCKNGKQLRR